MPSHKVALLVFAVEFRPLICSDPAAKRKELGLWALLFASDLMP